MKFKFANYFKQLLKESNQVDFQDLKLEDIISDKKLLLDPNIQNIFDKCKNNISRKIDGNEIEIWRVMVVSQDWVDSLFNNTDVSLGKYWAYSKDAAHNYWVGNGDKQVLIGARARLNQVDWEYTFKVKLKNDPDDYEEEIGLNSGSYISIFELEIDGENIDITEISGLDFRV
jgi:hypothetical protein